MSRLDDELVRLQTDTGEDVKQLRTRLQEQEGRLKDIERRLSGLEQKLTEKNSSRKEPKKTIVQQLTLPIAMICVTVIIVALLRLF